MNTRLKIICIIFGLAYLFVIGDYVYQNITFEMPQEIETQLESKDYYALGYDYGTRAKQGELPNPIIGIILPLIGMILTSLSILFFLIYIPVETYKTIRSIIKNDIFDQKNIKRMRRIGYSLLIIFILLLILYPLFYYMYQNILGIDLKSDMGSIRDDYTFLLMGLLVLLFAEVMKISHTIKEENDLMI